MNTTATIASTTNILFVEDNPQDVQLLETAFEPYRGRLDFRSVPNVISALDFLAKRGRYTAMPTPDLILLDLNLPVASGHRLLGDIENDPAWKQIPVIVLSSSNRKEDIELAYRLGAMLYVVKPSHWDRYTDLASSFARLAGVPPTQTRPPSGRSRQG
jgi:CheY-like chemotaxis protein